MRLPLWIRLNLSRINLHLIILSGLLCLWLFCPNRCAGDQLIGGFTAVSNIDFSGNNVVVDSFDSRDPYHSSWQTNWNYRGSNYGLYPTNPLSMSISAPDAATEPYWHKDNVFLSTTASIMNLGNCAVYGSVATPSNGSAKIDANASVGDVFWVPNYPGIQPGHLFTNMSAVFPDVTPPTNNYISVSRLSGANQPIYGNTNQGYYKFGYVITNTGYYSTLNQVRDSVYVKATNVVLYLPNGINFSNNAQNTTIWVETNSDLTIYVGANIDTTGNVGINNISQYAPAVRVYGMSGCTSIKLGGQTTITASIYAPEAAMNLNGGGSGYYHFVGSFLVQSLRLTGNMGFHYDEAFNPSTPPTIVSQPTNQIVPAGTNVSFTVSGSSFSSMSYQWQFNQTNTLSGANNATLILSNVQPTDSGVYSVVVTNACGSITSAPASLFVYTCAAATLSPLMSATNGVQFSVTGVPGLNYVVQTSSNLVDWVPLITNQPPFKFSDSDATNFAQRFYRAVCSPP
jgi:hypothetical protein